MCICTLFTSDQETTNDLVVGGLAGIASAEG
jgi:hypothetical protein